MNWYLQSVSDDLGDLDQKLIEYSRAAAEVIQDWLVNFQPEAEVQPPAYDSEKPSRLYGTFFAEGPWYHFRFTTGWYDKKYGYVKLGRIPYDITIERTDPGTYANEVGLQFPSRFLRVRKIGESNVIE